MEEQKRQFKIMISVLVLVILAGMLYSVGIHGIHETFQINFGEFSLAIATIVLAIFTYQLASYTYKLASVEIEENKKERRRLRIHEQLKNFYAPLRAEVEFFFNLDNESLQKRNNFEDMIKQLNVKSKYEFYSSEILKDELRTYFTDYYKKLRDSQYLLKHINKIDYLCDQILREYQELTKEYLELSEDRELGN